ncbi:hypothetical protein O181_111379 [Austropuccinia psidii MF-1]|uniref:Uncharacterized protein n=1 Tax=Austropuccinia psidii MF-1 TaxID=1389203 RepID=A0A9Q3K002_9BASI|nr:hypothetical protein [Austropuccinia psidii MF-1]
MNSWHILKKFLKEDEIVRYSNRWNPLSSKPQIKKIKSTMPKRGRKARKKPQYLLPESLKPTNLPRKGRRTRKKFEGTIFLKLRDSKNPKRCHGQCLQYAQNLDGIIGQRGTKNETTSFPKEITFSPDFVNTLTEIKETILPVKCIKNSFIYLQEINNNLSSLTKNFVHNKREIDNIKYMVENNKPECLIESTQKLIQGQQELYKYMKDIKEKTLTINYDMSIENPTEKLNNLSISFEKFEEKTSSHQKLCLDHVEKSDQEIMDFKDDIQSEIILITEKMDKFHEANLNMPKLSTPFVI